MIAVWENGQQVIQDDPVLTLPHPRAHLRAFVLVPLAEIAPDTVLASRGPLEDLLHTDAVAADAPTVRPGPSLVEGRQVVRCDVSGWR